MKRPIQEVLLHGVLSGLLAGAVVALWFLVVDLLAGEAFRTPALLASTFLEREVAGAPFRFVFAYSVLHFGVFTLLGIATVSFLVVTRFSPGWLLGLIFGIGVLDGVYYMALLLTGSNVLTVLPTHHVLGSNVVGGMVLMTYLHRGLRDESPLGFASLKQHALVSKGLLTGLIGAGGVALWFFIIDILSGQPFRTPAALGSAVLLGVSSVADVQINVGIVAAYTILHLAAFAAGGILFVAAAEQVERVPGMWLLFTLAFIVLEALLIPVLSLVSGWVMGTLGMWAISIGNLIAVASMGAWVWHTHPALRQKLLHEKLATQV